MSDQAQASVNQRFRTGVKLLDRDLSAIPTNSDEVAKINAVLEKDSLTEEDIKEVLSPTFFRAYYNLTKPENISEHEALFKQEVLTILNEARSYIRETFPKLTSTSLVSEILEEITSPDFRADSKSLDDIFPKPKEMVAAPAWQVVGFNAHPQVRLLCYSASDEKIFDFHADPEFLMQLGDLTLSTLEREFSSIASLHGVGLKFPFADNIQSNVQEFTRKMKIHLEKLNDNVGGIFSKK